MEDLNLTLSKLELVLEHPEYFEYETEFRNIFQIHSLTPITRNRCYYGMILFDLYQFRDNTGSKIELTTDQIHILKLRLL